MDLFSSMEVSAAGLGTQRTRMNVASSNLANVSTTRTPQGGPYQRQDVMVRAVPLDPSLTGSAPSLSQVQSVEVAAITADPNPPRMEYDPGHPDANAQGYVAYPNVNPVEEMVDMITASRAYEAGISALNTAVDMAEKAIGIGR